jgi:hypothetical protein
MLTQVNHTEPCRGSVVERRTTLGPTFRSLLSSLFWFAFDEDSLMGKRLWRLLGLVTVACLAIAGYVAWEVTRPPPPIHDFYANIEIGMTREQVQAIFGDWWAHPQQSTRPVYHPVDGKISPDATMVFIWGWYEQAVLIRFDADDRVQEKAFATVEWQGESWDRRIRRAIGML